MTKKISPKKLGRIEAGEISTDLREYVDAARKLSWSLRKSKENGGAAIALADLQSILEGMEKIAANIAVITTAKPMSNSKLAKSGSDEAMFNRFKTLEL